MSKPRLFLMVEGGVLQTIECDIPLEVTFIDYDNAREDPEDYDETPEEMGGSRGAVDKCLIEMNETLAEMRAEVREHPNG